MFEKKLNLNGKWSLYYCHEKEFHAFGFDGSIESLNKLNKIPAIVPGCFERDFSAAGLLPEDLFYSDNILQVRKFEDLHLFYVKSFVSDKKEGVLTFEGVDTLANIYLNGSLILSCDNMMIAHQVQVSNLQQENELIVHIRPVVIEAQKYTLPDYCFFSPYTKESAYIRKPPHMFGWDIMPRAISGGIWKDVYITEVKEKIIEDVFLYTKKIDGRDAEISLSFRFNANNEVYTYRVIGSCGQSEFVADGKFSQKQVTRNIQVENARLWWPKNYGKPNLYDIEITVCKDGEIIDTQKLRFGIRTTQLVRTSVVDEKGGDFCFYVNGKKIYVMGTNWTPLSPFHYQDIERLQTAFNFLLECNCNGVRCWGGNVYESDQFYDLCDENGILVWQDFAMACAYYPQDELLFAQIRKEVHSVVKRLRNHSSILLWSGDNECDINIRFAKGNPKDNLITRKVIPEILDELDGSRPYLPSSPYLDEHAFTSGLPTSEDHTWGDRSYYKGEYYANTKCCFASEMGFPGAPAVSTIKKYISAEQVWPWKDEVGYEGFDPEGKNFIDAMNKDKPQDDWLLHSTAIEKGLTIYSYQVPLLAYSACYLFGDKGDDIYRFVMKSQVTQAEAFKFNIERYRLAKWNKTGLMWWNLIDGWPCTTNTLVDFYYKKKLAFEFVKRAQNAVLVAFSEQVDGKYQVVVCNDLQTNKTVKIKITNITKDIIVYEGEVCALSNANTDVCLLPAERKDFYKIEFCYDSEQHISHYIDDLVDSDFDTYLKYLREIQVDEYIVLGD